MFVRRNRVSKGDVSQVLQSVGKVVVLGVCGLPQPVSLGEFLRRKGGKSQQVVRSIFDHVDSQVVSCVNAKVWPVRIANGESFKFQKTVEGRVFHSLDLWDVHQTPDSLGVPYLAVGREHRTQLERQHVRIVPAYGSISFSDLCRRLDRKSTRLNSRHLGSSS